MRFYLDSSVTHVYLFGIEKEPKRYSDVVRLFDAINAGQIDGVVSVYTVQELCVYSCSISSTSAVNSRPKSQAHLSARPARRSTPSGSIRAQIQQ